MLCPFDEVQFVYELNLKNFKQKDVGFNFSCPLCHEGKSPHKTRAWILLSSPKYDHNTFICHNCLPEGISIRKFISLVDISVFERYKILEKKQYIDDIQSGKIFNKKPGFNSYNRKLENIPKHIFRLNSKTFVPCNAVPEAVQYCKSRKIDEKHINELYFCPRTDLAYGNMIIFPLRYDNDKVYGFQGRSIKGKRFSTFMPNDDYKVYNLFNVDRTSNVYVFESIIDSYVINNSISMLGADLSKPVRKILEKPVFVFDNDRTGEEKTLKYINAGERCFIWPNGITAKDFGELTEKGIENIKLRKLIKSNIFSGLQGEIEIKLKLTKSKSSFRRLNYAV